MVCQYLASFRTTPYVEVFRKARQEAERKAKQKREEAIKKIATLEKEVSLLKDEVLRSLAGASAFDRDEFNNLLLEKRGALSKAQSDLEQLNVDESSSEIGKMEAEIQRMSVWAKEYSDANNEIKHMILHKLIKRVTIRRGYKINIELTVTAQQFAGEGEGSAS